MAIPRLFAHGLLLGALLPCPQGNALCPALPQEESPEDDLGRRVDRYVSRLEKLGFSGAVMLTRNGEIELAKGYGLSNRLAGTPATSDTAFPLGSITKHFTAAAILRLEMDGHLSVDDPIEFFFQDIPPDKASITIHQLLSHTSGLPAASMTALESASSEDFVARCLACELLFRPGAGSSYSNLGYGLLAAIIERVSESTWEQYLSKALFQPAGMASTGSALPKWPGGSLAHGYIDDRDTGTLLDSGRGDSWGLIGAGGLLSTIGDMEKWNLALEQESVLDGPTIAKMTAAYSGDAGGFGMGYGCGLGTTPDGQRWFGHNGSDDVFSADFRRYPDDGLFLFTAGNNADMYCFDFTGAIERMSFGHDVELPPDVVVLSPDRLTRYAGQWNLPDGQSIVVRPRAEGLVFGSAGRAAALLHPVRPNQVARRAQLLTGLESAFRAAVEGDFAALHQLLDPFSPLAEFTGMWAQTLDDWSAQLGPSRSIRAIPGRNRFGEIAIVVVLSFEGAERKIEYSFGEREVGSIRFLDDYPVRVCYPESGSIFASYEVESAQTWRVSFRLGTDDAPLALVLKDEKGEEFVATRER